MNKKRPVNLALTTMHFPVMAIASILHRLSGVALFFLLPFMLYFLHLSLQSPESFAYLGTLLTRSCYQMLVWVFLAALVYHLLAGCRHLLMDMNIGEELSTGRWSAYLVIISSFILVLLLGVWIW